MAIRSERLSLFQLGIFSNKALIITVTLTFLMQLIIIYTPFLNRLFKLQPLTMKELALCVGISSAIFIAVEIEKWLRRSRASKQNKNN